MPSLLTYLKKHRLTCCLILLSLLGYLLTLVLPHFPYATEHYYSLGINRYYRQAFSLFFGIFPFSFYEFLLYSVIALVLAFTLYRLYHIFIQRAHWQKHLCKWLIHMINFGLIIWCLLIYTWTLNYARLPLEETMSLDISSHDQEELAMLYDHLIDQLNSLANKVPRDANGYMTIPGGYRSVFDRTQAAYDALGKDYPMFNGKYGRPKPIALSGPMLYTNITGIYDAFTAEPNINIAILPQSLPVTTLHELAHQRGFAPEDEANFIATLACTYSEDVDFQYSGYLLAYIYTNRSLYAIDPDKLHHLNKSLDESVKLDVLHNNAFWQNYEGLTEEISSTLNDSYLKANGVPDGEASYGRMVDLLLAYYHTHPDF